MSCEVKNCIYLELFWTDWARRDDFFTGENNNMDKGFVF